MFNRIFLLLFFISGFGLLYPGDVSVISEDKPSFQKFVKDNIEKLGIKTDFSVRVKIYRFSSQSEIFSVKNDSLSIEKGIIEISALLTVIKNNKPYSMHIVKANGKNETEAVSEFSKRIKLILIKFL